MHFFPSPQHALESEAVALVVGLGGGPKTRSSVARALRAWRRAGNYSRAKWFRKHVSFITGHLFK